MSTVGLVVEGHVDRVVCEKLLRSRDVAVDPRRIIITNGKSKLDARLAHYNKAARHGGWLVLRDADRDAGDCPAALRRSLLTVPQSPPLCLRLAVRTVEAWLLADAEAFSSHFAVVRSRIPVDPEGELRPKEALVNACRASQRRDVRVGMTPPAGKTGVGPEYTTFLSDYCRRSWRPDVAAASAPSLTRALREIDRLLTTSVWL